MLAGKAIDADGDDLRRARFVRLEEAEQCRGHARCQVCTLMWTRRAEWERLGRVAEVFEPCLGILARYQVYVTIRVDDHPDEEEEEKEWGSRTDFVE
jgi:hypothetical protein